MPPIIAAVVAGIAASTAISTAVGIALTIGLNFAFNAISAALAGKPDKKKLADRRAEILTTVRDPVRSREMVVGEVRKGGTIIYITSTNSQRDLHLVVALAGHECEAIKEIFFNEDLAFDAAGAVQPKFSGKAFVNKHLGSPTQTADTDLVAAATGEWTSAHRLQGICYIYVKLIFDRELFTAIPNISAIVKGAKFFDPRTSQTVWTDNAALVNAGYLNDATYGLGAAYGTEIDNTELIAAANISDELVSIPGASTEKRYTANGIIDSADDPQSNIERLLTAMHGRLIYSGGKWIFKAGAFEAPAVTLDENDLRGNLKVTPRLAKRDLFNAIRGIFVSPKNKYQPADFPPITSATFQAQDNGERIWKDIELPYTVTETMAYRIAKIDLFSAREQISVAYPCSLKGLLLRAGDTVNINNTRMGWSNKTFLVTDWSFANQGAEDAPVLGINLMLRETSAAVYSVTADEQTLIAAAPDTTLPPPDTVRGTILTGKIISVPPRTFAAQPGAVSSGTLVRASGPDIADGAITGSKFDTVPPAVPTGLTLATGVQVDPGDGVAKPFLDISWNANAESDLDRYEIQYRRQGDAVLTVRVVQKPQTSIREIGVVGNVTHEARIQAIDKLGNPSGFTTFSTIVTTKDTTAPAVPTGVTVTPGFQLNVIKWTPPADVDWDVVEIWRSLTNDSSTATKIGEHRGILFVDDKLANATQYFYWLKSRDKSGNVSAFHAGQFSGVSGTTLKIAGADVLTTEAIITASAQIANAIIGNAHIADLSADKITAGLIDVLVRLGVNNIELDGVNSVITIKDTQGTPQTRVQIGKLGAGSSDWGIQIFDSSGTLMWSFTSGAQSAGIANAAVATAKIANNAVSNIVEDAIDGSVAVGTSEVTLASVTFTSTGGVLVVIGKCVNTDGAGTTENLTISLKRGTTTIDSALASIMYNQVIALMKIDQPAAGSVTYNLTGQRGSGTGDVNQRRVQVVELKK